MVVRKGVHLRCHYSIICGVAFFLLTFPAAIIFLISESTPDWSLPGFALHASGREDVRPAKDKTLTLSFCRTLI